MVKNGHYLHTFPANKWTSEIFTSQNTAGLCQLFCFGMHNIISCAKVAVNHYLFLEFNDLIMPYTSIVSPPYSVTLYF